MVFESDILIIGGGAAGLMAAIWARRTAPGHSVVVFDGASKLGAKILVAGGGRCNVTHDTIDASAYAGSSPNAIRKVMRQFDVPDTVRFFRELGVSLKREETGKLFPTTDSGRTILQALLTAANSAGVRIDHPRRVEWVTRTESGFVVGGAWGQAQAQRVVLATGGRSLPKSGSDGHGYQIATALGHTLTDAIFPALVPLTLPADHFLRRLSGVAIPATLELWSGSNKRLVTFTDSTLFTHFGLSGPGILDISRYAIEARRRDPATYLTLNCIPAFSAESADAALLRAGKASVMRWLSAQIPVRLASALCDVANIEGNPVIDALSREARRRLVTALTRLVLPITGDRGFNYAEVTAGGIPLGEIRLGTMESRVCAGLHLCGEICDVDGRIGGYNFQWAWSSGYVAGVGAAAALGAP